MNSQPTIALFGAGNHGRDAVWPAIVRLSERLKLAAIVEPFAPNAARAHELEAPIWTNQTTHQIRIDNLILNQVL